MKTRRQLIMIVEDPGMGVFVRDEAVAVGIDVSVVASVKAYRSLTATRMCCLRSLSSWYCIRVSSFDSLDESAGSVLFYGESYIG